MTTPASLLSLLQHRRPLLLQGPMGPFFARLADYLTSHGQQVRKVNFNGGDQVFYRRPDADAYRGSFEAWPAWLAQHLTEHRIDAIVLFGQSRPVHEAARRVATALRIEVYVFEEGYLRPDYVTLERGGVNGLSSLPRDARFYAKRPDKPVPRPEPTRHRFRMLAAYAMVYLLAMMLWKPYYRGQLHHRPSNPFVEGMCWLRGGLRKVLWRRKERGVLDALASPEAGEWFLLPLQVHNDAQLLHHSPYPRMEDAIDEVMLSFALHADKAARLVIKHHPMDRPYTDYSHFIAQRAEAHGLMGRVLYVHDLHLPTLLKFTAGVVTVNSTVGLQALFHDTPVHVLGQCVYAIDGLVHRQPLGSFWTAPGTVDAKLFARFRYHLVTQTQLNASFHGLACALEGPARIDTALQGFSRLSRPVGQGLVFTDSVIG